MDNPNPFCPPDAASKDRTIASAEARGIDVPPSHCTRFFPSASTMRENVRVPSEPTTS